MATTNRQRAKDQQEGELVTTASMSDAKTAVRDMHSRAYPLYKAGTENAATNVAETTCLAHVPVKSRARAFGISVVTNIAANATDYLIVRFFGRTNGTSTLLGSWNTHTSAQGALNTSNVARIVAGAGLVTNANGIVAADSRITFSVGKAGAGQLLDPGMIFSAWLEEI